jgi:hypothetical protein
VRLEGLGQLKNLMNLSVFEPAIFRHMTDKVLSVEYESYFFGIEGELKTFKSVKMPRWIFRHQYTVPCAIKLKFPPDKAWKGAQNMPEW